MTHLLRVERMERGARSRGDRAEIRERSHPSARGAAAPPRFAHQLHDGGDVFDDCTRTIIQQVDELKNLVNGSRRSRAPAAGTCRRT
jgi:hypothetical protein